MWIGGDGCNIDKNVLKYDYENYRKVFNANVVDVGFMLGIMHK